MFFYHKLHFSSWPLLPVNTIVIFTVSLYLEPRVHVRIF